MQLRLAFVFFLSLFSQEGFAAPHSIHIRLSSAPRTLDWNVATTGIESSIIQNIMMGLFSGVGTTTPKLALAKSYEWSANRKDLKVILNDQAEWDDQKKLNSAQFLDSFERLLNPTLNSENASLLFDVVGARDYFLGKTKSFKKVGIEAPNPSTLIFHLNEPRANFIHILAHWSTFPIRKDNPKITLGPYRLKSKTSKEIVLVARDLHAPIQTAFFEVIPDGKAAIALFRSKKIDYLLLLEDALLDSPDLKGLPAPGFVNPIRVVALLHLNPTRVLTNTPEKRRAIMKAIPLAELVSPSRLSSRFAAKSIIPPGVIGGPELTENSSFIPEGKTGDLPKESLTLAYPDDSLSKAIAEQIRAQSKDLKFILETLPKGDRASAARYDLVISIFGLDYLDPDQLLSSFLSQGTHDLFNVSSSELLKLVQAARSTDSIKDRSKFYRDAADYLENKTAIVMPLFYRRRAYLIRENYGFDTDFQGTSNLSLIRTQK